MTVVAGTTDVKVLVAGGAEVIRQVQAALIWLAGLPAIPDGKSATVRLFLLGARVQPAYSMR